MLLENCRLSKSCCIFKTLVGPNEFELKLCFFRCLKRSWLDNLQTPWFIMKCIQKVVTVAIASAPPTTHLLELFKDLFQTPQIMNSERGKLGYL